MEDMYLDENGVLRNKLGITSESMLQKVEYKISKIQIAIIESKLKDVVKYNYDYLIFLHKQIFGDIYEWAGDLRKQKILHHYGRHILLEKEIQEHAHFL